MQLPLQGCLQLLHIRDKAILCCLHEHERLKYYQSASKARVKVLQDLTAFMSTRGLAKLNLLTIGCCGHRAHNLQVRWLHFQDSRWFCSAHVVPATLSSARYPILKPPPGACWLQAVSAP